MDGGAAQRTCRGRRGRTQTPCQGEGRGFESRLPLSKSRLLAGLMRIARLIEFTVSAHHCPSLAHHGTRLERWMRPRVRFVSGGVVHSSCGSTEGLIQASGKRRWLTRTVRGDRSDALRELKALAAHANIAPAVGAHTTVAALLDQWFARGRSTWSPTTIRNLTSIVERHLSRVSVTSWWATSRRPSSMSSTTTCAQQAGSMASLWRLARYDVSTLRFTLPRSGATLDLGVRERGRPCNSAQG